MKRGRECWLPTPTRAGDEARTRDLLLGNYPDSMQTANESGVANGSMLAANN